MFSGGDNKTKATVNAGLAYEHEDPETGKNCAEARMKTLRCGVCKAATSQPYCDRCHYLKYGNSDEEESEYDSDVD